MIRPIVLTIAGSDSIAGAGIQADLKAIHALGAYAVTVITAITAQNTRKVERVEPVPLDLIRDQLHAVFDDCKIDAVKIGMLANASIVELVARELAKRKTPWIVLDPVMISKHGHALLDDDAVEVLRDKLMPLASVITPNLPEAERLCGFPVRNEDDMQKAGRELIKLGPDYVIIKGGHLGDGQHSADLFVSEDNTTWLMGVRYLTPHTHGTGCTFASAMAGRLACGDTMLEAAQEAKIFITNAIRHGLRIGKGSGPVDPFYDIPGAEEDNG
ncbi:MAG: bifunctional hydroxymethylpyrimidine kinase/phosphomethylpyrimidine kinase [Candidatus Eisenbacteria bacterium]|uniref:hydroxymethylpyrimidine kinase n=1 Tax=Eiseniibacteriota bacterium TaxID=2212470 RepID=A0A948RVG9_UNCEI|nr:bifunctional hydroxymethylpyrimidine kinase/phosphomethylpyrimidine kinase [Candidatus Eisenbacteria bacterium]MBU1949376.1 bifunctional hydroxymethylpyrimidine kinase/phosphomethylpyrimidine kinase [Candidatus Eisenbacteria bacterium]MBU2690449.1 bifunctional hydroxymethylpyrimidine kinase/phosphomethylpyrimidine kinase [Candidatus Eisenbacteria bacterium]